MPRCALLPVLQRGLHTPHLATPGADLQQTPGPPGSLSGVAQLLLFLCGSPDIGIGKTVAMTAAGGLAGPGGRSAAAGGRVVSPGAGDISRQVGGASCLAAARLDFAWSWAASCCSSVSAAAATMHSQDWWIITVCCIHKPCCCSSLCSACCVAVTRTRALTWLHA
jgi:hypothetical protein